MLKIYFEQEKLIFIEENMQMTVVSEAIVKFHCRVNKRPFFMRQKLLHKYIYIVYMKHIQLENKHSLLIYPPFINETN